MIKLPAREDGNWTVQYANESLPDIVETKNLTFDVGGKISLSKPTIAFYTSADDADFGIPLKYARGANNSYMLPTGDRPFYFSFEGGNFYIGKDSSTDSPTGQLSNSHATIFNNELVVVENGDIHTWDFGFDWTDQVVTLDTFTIHPVVNFVSQNSLAVTDENNAVELYSTAYSAGTKLIIPDDYRICAMAYNRGYLGIATYDGRFNGNGYFFIWDGNTASANYAYPLNTYAGTTVIPHGDTFLIYTSESQLLYWTGSGLESIANFPAYYTAGGLSHSTYITSFGDSHADGWVTKGGRAFINRNGELNEPDSRGRKFIHGNSGGVWVFDKSVGLYHKFATTANKFIHDFLNEGSVNITTDQITVASAPDTGTPVYYSSSGDTAVGGLTNGGLYYTIKVDGTHVKLATTYANAIAGTAINLTSDITDPVVATTAVNTTTERVAINASITGGYGHPVVYNANGGTEIGGLTDGTTYYTTFANTFSSIALSSSFANAMELTYIDLTGTGNDSQSFSLNAHSLTFIPKKDFGQLYTTGQQGCLDVYDRTDNVYGSGRPIGTGFLWGSFSATTNTTEIYSGGLTLRGTENRGYFVTSVFKSAQLQDDWQKLFLKHSKLTGEFDEIHVKYRTRTEDLVDVGINDSGSANALITWTDANTFTSTDAQYATVQAGDEVEVVQGAGSGYLLHVSSITEDSGTYTVNLTESVKNISASDTGRAVVSHWTYLTTLDSDTITNEDGYSEIAIGVKSKSIQFKIELRGEDVEIEELLIAHQLHKPIA